MADVMNYATSDKCIEKYVCRFSTFITNVFNALFIDQSVLNILEVF